MHGSVLTAESWLLDLLPGCGGWSERGDGSAASVGSCDHEEHISGAEKHRSRKGGLPVMGEICCRHGAAWSQSRDAGPSRARQQLVLAVRSFACCPSSIALIRQSCIVPIMSALVSQPSGGYCRVADRTAESIDAGAKRFEGRVAVLALLQSSPGMSSSNNLHMSTKPCLRTRKYWGSVERTVDLATGPSKAIAFHDFWGFRSCWPPC